MRSARTAQALGIAQHISTCPHVHITTCTYINMVLPHRTPYDLRPRSFVHGPNKPSDLISHISSYTRLAVQYDSKPNRTRAFYIDKCVRTLKRVIYLLFMVWLDVDRRTDGRCPAPAAQTKGVLFILLYYSYCWLVVGLQYYTSEFCSTVLCSDFRRSMYITSVPLQYCSHDT